MAVWKYACKTIQGINLDLKLVGRENLSLRLTRAVSGSEKINPTQLMGLTDVIEPRQELQLLDVIEHIDENKVMIPIILRNAGVKKKYDMYQIGIYAQDPDLGEILYIVLQSEGAEEIPSGAEMKDFKLEWYINMSVSNAENIEVIIDETGVLTVEQADARYVSQIRYESTVEKLDTDIKSTEVKLQKEITAEADRAMEAEGQLKKELDAETARAMEVERQLEKAKVEKVPGKGLSTNDYTTAEKNKLSGITAGAEVNVQADWNVTDTNSDAYIKNKPTSLPANGGTAKTISDTLPISKGGTGQTTGEGAANVLLNSLSEGTSMPSDNDYYISQYAGGGTITTSYHRRPVSKLWDYIKAKLATVAISGSYNDLSNKPSIPIVGNGTVTIKQAGVQKGTFTMNQSGNTTIELADSNNTYSAGNQLTLSGNQFKISDNCTIVTDWNSAISNGWYMAFNGTHAPQANSWFYGITICHNSKYVRQIVFRFASDSNISGSNSHRYERICQNGTWGAWTDTSVLKAVPADAVFTDHTYPIYTASLPADFASKYRTITKGNANAGNYISNIRTDVARVTGAPQFGAGLAWGSGDTHSYLNTAFSTPHAYIGAGNADVLQWVREIAFKNAEELISANLDDYKTEGHYYAGGGNKVTGKPADVGPFGLWVQRAAYGIYVQHLYDGDAKCEYTRVWNNNFWSAWVTQVIGIKGNLESVYRSGYVNLTPANVGALPLSGGNMNKNASIRLTGSNGISNEISLSSDDGYNTVIRPGEINTPELITGKINYDDDIIHVKNGKNFSILDTDNYDKYAASKEVYGDDYVSFGRRPGTTVGECSFCWAAYGIVTGDYSAIIGGDFNEVSGDKSFCAGGGNSVIYGNYAACVGGSDHTIDWETSDGVCIGGYENAIAGSAEESGCFAGKNNTVSDGWESVCIGGSFNTITGNDSVIVGGYNNKNTHIASVAISGHHLETTGNDQLVMGYYNATVGSNPPTAFVIGNGTSSARSNAVRIDYTGQMWCKATYSTTGADYAEFFEWEDGNPSNEDRRGYFVTMVGYKIKKATTGDYILGIVSANPSILGNGDMEWQGQFLKDDFGAYLTEEFTETVKRKRFEHVVKEDGTKERVEVEYEEEVSGTRYVQNPDYDPDMEYIDRMSRPEWDAIGMIGVLAVYDDGTCMPGSFCAVSADGIATAAGNAEYEIVDGKIVKNYRVIERITENIVKVVLR